MKTLLEARIWVLRDLTAVSLRRKAATLKAGDIVHNPANITDAGVKRVKKEIERLADQLEARAARLAGMPDTLQEPLEEVHGGASGDPADLSGEFDK